MYLSVFDLSGIQHYIYSSNKLSENIGASYLLSQALEEWLDEATDVAGKEAQVCWSGGGNAMVRTASLEQSRAVAAELSWRLHDRAPGLEVACVHHEWDGDHASFSQVREALFEALEAAKAGQLPPASFDGAGVTARCLVDDTPAVELNRQDSRFLGPAAAAKAAAAPKAEAKLQSLFKLPADRYAWTNETERLGRSRGDRSLLGVVHFDGNQMGERFRAPASLSELTELSRAVRDAGREALRDALDWLLKQMQGITDTERGGFELHACGDGDERKRCFPVRPLIYGGDDITLICDGRIALDLASTLLQAWTSQTRGLPNGEAFACAGVALVNAHYPFSRACQLAEELCANAKRWVRQNVGEDASALDWELLGGGGPVELEERRERFGLAADGRRGLVGAHRLDDYRDASSSMHDGRALHARPYLVVGEPPSLMAHRQWRWFRWTLIHAVQEAEHHSQLRLLASVLHEGVEATRELLRHLEQRHQLTLPAPRRHSLSAGFANAETPYLDALELMDILLPTECFTMSESVESGQEGEA